MASSGTVGWETYMKASQYNNLRTDILDASSGHTHTGSADDGRQLTRYAFEDDSITPAKIKNKDRTLFVPAMAAYNDSGTAHINRTLDITSTFDLPSGSVSYVVGRHILPEIYNDNFYVSVLTFTDRPSGSASMRLRYDFTNLATGSVDSTETAITSVSPGERSFSWKQLMRTQGSPSLPGTARLIMELRAKRVGTAAADSYDGSIKVVGFIVDYEAKI